MKNTRKKRNKEKITNRNRYRLKRSIKIKSYTQITNQISTDEIFIENLQRDLVSKCYKEANRELKKWGLKPFYLEEKKVENRLGQQSDDFVQDRFTLLVGVDYEIKFIN